MGRFWLMDVSVDRGSALSAGEKTSRKDATGKTPVRFPPEEIT
jgi:hypothetical protein